MIHPSVLKSPLPNSPNAEEFSNRGVDEGRYSEQNSPAHTIRATLSKRHIRISSVGYPVSLYPSLVNTVNGYQCPHTGSRSVGWGCPYGRFGKSLGYQQRESYARFILGALRVADLQIHKHITVCCEVVATNTGNSDCRQSFRVPGTPLLFPGRRWIEDGVKADHTVKLEVQHG